MRIGQIISVADPELYKRQRQKPDPDRIKVKSCEGSFWSHGGSEWSPGGSEWSRVRLTLGPCGVFRPMVADSHPFDEELDRNLYKV